MLQMKTTHLVDFIKNRKKKSEIAIFLLLLFWKTRNEGAMEVSSEQTGTIKP